MLALEAALRQKTATLNKVQGSLRFGIGELSAATWFSKFVSHMARTHPELVIEPLVSQARSMEIEVERGTLDCAVIAGWPAASGWARKCFAASLFAGWRRRA